MPRRAPRPLSLAREVTSRRSPNPWSPDGRPGWSSHRCPDCGDWTTAHSAAPRQSRCDACIAYRTGLLSASDWELAVLAPDRYRLMMEGEGPDRAAWVEEVA